MRFEEIAHTETYADDNKKSKFNTILNGLIADKKMNEITHVLEKIQEFDIYRFFRKYGRVVYSKIELDKDWGCFFNEAIILYKDFIVTVHHDWFDFDNKRRYTTIYHKRESEIRKLIKDLEDWVIENSIFRGEQFTFPEIEKPKMSKAYFVNNSSKKLIEENTVLFFRKLREMRKRGIKTRRGIILYGKPGNGKTSICRWISKSLLGVTRIWVTDWDMEYSGLVSTLFKIARNLSPAVIFMEDIDTVGISRHFSGKMESILGRLLNEMDGIKRNDGIVVIATTNNIHVLDRALANRPGRFDLKIKIGNPHPRIVKRITGHEDNITLAEAFRRKEDRIYYEEILGRKYKNPIKRNSVHYIG